MGEGGLATVYRASDVGQADPTVFALKHMRLANAEAVRDMADEARTLAKVKCKADQSVIHRLLFYPDLILQLLPPGPMLIIAILHNYAFMVVMVLKLLTLRLALVKISDWIPFNTLDDPYLHPTAPRPPSYPGAGRNCLCWAGRSGN